MVDAAPFRALRYDPHVAGPPASTSAPAYDDLERFTYAEHRTASPYTVLELLAARDAGSVYERWRRTGVLVADATPAFYRYEQHELRHGVPAVLRGVLAAVAIESGGGAVLAHEDVDPARVARQVQRLEAVPVDLSPVFACAVDAGPTLRDVLARSPDAPPVAALTDEAGVDHRVWALRDEEQVTAVREGLAGAAVVIADGHHRYAAARALCERRRPAAAGAPDAPGRSLLQARTLMYLVDVAAHGPQVLPIHRLVRRLPDDVRERLASDFEAVDAPADALALAERVRDVPGRAFGLLLGAARSAPTAATGGATAMLLRPRRRGPDQEVLLRIRAPAGRSGRWRALDTAVLDYGVLPGLGVSGEDVAYRADLAAAAAQVAEGAFDGLFVLAPVDAATVFAFAAAGEPMPPKTTHFRPKPRTGLVMRPLAD